MLGQNASRVKIISALSPVALAAAGSTGVVDLSGFSFATVVAQLGSGGSAGTNRVLVNVLRSATSDGTFSSFGASFPNLSANNQLYARSFVVDSSAGWHRVSYDNNNNGSHTMGIIIIAQAARTAPVDQDGQTTVYSDVLGG